MTQDFSSQEAMQQSQQNLPTLQSQCISTTGQSQSQSASDVPMIRSVPIQEYVLPVVGSLIQPLSGSSEQGFHSNIGRAARLAAYVSKSSQRWFILIMGLGHSFLMV
jgi:hypothetical protein